MHKQMPSEAQEPSRSPLPELISTQVAVAPWSKASSRMPSTLLWLSWVYTNCEPSCQGNASASSFNAPAALQKIVSLLAKGMPLQAISIPCNSVKIVSLLAKGMPLQLTSMPLQQCENCEPSCHRSTSVTFIAPATLQNTMSLLAKGMPAQPTSLPLQDHDRLTPRTI